MLQLSHFVLHVVESFYFGSVNVQISNYAPKVGELARLLLKHLLYRICVLKDGLVVIAQEVVIILLIDLQLLQSINQLVFPMNFKKGSFHSKVRQFYKNIFLKRKT